MLTGVDVSKWQGDINWTDVKNAGIEFAIIRVGYGTLWQDVKFQRNYNAAKDVSMPVGTYLYSLATTPEEAVVEAQTVIEWIKDKQFEYPVYFDIEEQSVADTGKENCTAIVKAFCEYMEDKGYFVGVYSNTYWYQNYIDFEELSKLYTIWKSDYRENFDTTLKCDIHQFTSQGAVSGISGNVDINNCTRDFSVIKEQGFNGFGKDNEDANPDIPSQEKPGSTELTETNINTGKITLVNEPLYASATATELFKKITGNYYIYDGKVINNKIRITNSFENIGKEPIGSYVTGYIAVPSNSNETSKANIYAGQKIVLENEPLYANSTANDSIRKLTGNYYVYDGKVFNKRIRITNSSTNVKKEPIGLYVTGYIKSVVDVDDDDLSAGEKIKLSSEPLYDSATSYVALKRISGEYYVYDNKIINNRIRITNSKNNVGKEPAGSYVTGYIIKPYK